MVIRTRNYRLSQLRRREDGMQLLMLTHSIENSRLNHAVPRISSLSSIDFVALGLVTSPELPVTAASISVAMSLSITGSSPWLFPESLPSPSTNGAYSKDSQCLRKIARQVPSRAKIYRIEIGTSRIAKNEELT